MLDLFSNRLTKKQAGNHFASFFFLFVYSNILFIAHMRATIEAKPKPIDNDDFIANVATSSAIISVAIEGS